MPPLAANKSLPSSVHWKRFENQLRETVKWSDRLGYVYWFAVLTTISCGFATGVYVTITNRTAMIESCQQKLHVLEDFLSTYQNTNLANHETNSTQSESKDADGIFNMWNRGNDDNVEHLIERADWMMDEIR